MKIAIVAGSRPPKNLISEIKNADYVIGVDRGSYFLIKLGVTPDLAIGDLDSVNHKELKLIKNNSKAVREFPAQKDETDLELAINESIKLNPKTVLIFGATGGRTDHSLTAIYLLKKLLEKNVEAKILDENQEIFLMNKDHSVKKSNYFHYFSIFSLNSDSVVSLTGFKYNLEKKLINAGDSFGVSNEIVDDIARIQIYQGTLLIVRSRDFW
ncbi:thiamine diphosphokinase [Candidatus Roizmanbacteria bacterium RIFCSPLOWO2_01_FULL_44_13]|uniref:Thiamine diphosphokinase n=1 Tax=Candidatus Roizmanbacteria bacterium RIFCSPLOWO2_01_FULL_44_13 TaxID=1802069 RepID=A0A1F7JBC7_9BACT|nr:MAG: thiamine diphosphokinase [Candidatus Roizmanbacteria bacterium RIFCSPLOWO2_01_FULL_44_13]